MGLSKKEEKNGNMLKERKLGCIGYIRSKLHKDKEDGLVQERSHFSTGEKRFGESTEWKKESQKQNARKHRDRRQ